MSDFIFDNWLEKMNTLYSKVEAELSEFKQAKQDVQDIKAEIYNQVKKGQFMFDDDRIVISAPEIIIGNVDKSGEMKLGQSSRVVIRSENISLEGVGERGTVDTKATHIHQTAEDPGESGLSGTVYEGAEIKQLARSIVLESIDAQGAYPKSVHKALHPGVSILSDNGIQLDASASRRVKEQLLNDEIVNLDTQISILTPQATSQKDALKQQVQKMEEVLQMDTKERASDELSNANIYALAALHYKLTSRSVQFFQALDEYLTTITKLSDAKRRKTHFENQKSHLPSSDDFKNATNCKISLNAEKVGISTRDADGEQRLGAAPSFEVNAPNIALGAKDEKEALLKGGSIVLRSEMLSLSTADAKKEGEDKTIYTATGSIRLNSKQIQLSSVDMEVNDNGTQQEKALTEGGKIFVRVKDMEFDTTDTEGKVVGSFAVNSEKIKFKSFDVEKDNRSDKGLAANGSIEAHATNVTLGGQDKDKKIYTVKNAIVSAENVNVFGKDMIEMTVEEQTGIKLNKDKLELSGKNKDFIGEKSTFHGENRFTRKVTSKKMQVQTLEVKKQLKTPSSSDGQPDPSPDPQDPTFKPQVKDEPKAILEKRKKEE